MTRERLPLPEPDCRLPMDGPPRYRADQMHAYADAETAALSAELFSTNERWENSHQIALAIQDERDALAEQVRVLREALELIAAPMRPDGTWNRERLACQQIAAAAL